MALDTKSRAWSPDSWRHKPAAQQPAWPDAQALERATAELSALPPLVFAGEARRLRTALGQVAAGEAFVLQAGDCAESFAEFTADSIRDKLRVILQMAVVLTYGAGVPVVKVGRIAGQFAKPRTNDSEFVDGSQLPSFRGHMVNGDEPTAEARVPDPGAHGEGLPPVRLDTQPPPGFHEGWLCRPHPSSLVEPTVRRRERTGTALRRDSGRDQRALRFMAACGIDLAAEGNLHQVELYTTHEALVLNYEEALTRRDSLTGDWYDCSAHMVWVGERTRQLKVPTSSSRPAYLQPDRGPRSGREHRQRT